MENKYSIIESIKGSKITKVFRICDMICFNFKLLDESYIKLHAQCLMRVFNNKNDLIICTQNLYNRSPNYKVKLFKRYNWTKIGSTVFDDALKKYLDQLLSSVIIKIDFDGYDLKLMLDNGMRIEFLVIVTEFDNPKYCENYRIFKNGIDEHTII